MPVLAAGLPDHVTPLARHIHAKTGLEIVSGEIQLPKGFHGRLQPAAGETTLILPTLMRVENPGAKAESAKEVADEADGEDEASEAPVPSKIEAGLDRFLVIAQRRGTASSARLELRDTQGVKVADLRFDMPVKTGDGKELQQWLTSRAYTIDLWSDVSSPLQAPLHRAEKAAYGLDAPWHWRDRRRFDDDSGPSLLALLGGRAAVDETLQMDRLLGVRGQKDKTKPKPDVALKDLQGIDTPPHPWAEMRAGRPEPNRPPLALCVPSDRAVLYLPKPKGALASLEGGGASFLQRVSTFTGNGGMDTNVVARIFEDLGLGDGRGRRLITSGAIREAVLFFPDLAFLAGTEATVVADLARPEEASFLPQGGPHSYKTPGGQAFAARRGDRIFLSTSKTELEQALALNAANGKGSLGASDEFAVILDKLAPTADTEFFFYLPDGFIRQLLGPRLRILQMRQALARSAMEEVAAAALLRRMDVSGAPLSIQDLKTRGYLAADADLRQISLGSDGRVRHAVFGPLERPWPLGRVPLATVKGEEAEAYAGFKEAYSRYWSRYFDPIAMRLDVKDDGHMALETFVLPLIESSIYEPVQMFLTSKGGLPRPQWRQPMVAELALRFINENLEGRENPRGIRGLFREFPWLKDGLLKHGTGVVVAGFPDGAPIIATGNGSPATILQADPFGSRNGLVGLGALALGVFTRPVVLAFELKDPEATRRSLQDDFFRLLPMDARLSREIEIKPAVEPDGGIHIRVSLFGMASMRFTARVEDRWLVITNDASQPLSLVAGTVPGEPFAARLSLSPESLHQGLPAAFQASVEGEAKSAFASMAWLTPWLIASGDAKFAMAESRRILGNAPVLDPAAIAPERWWEHRQYGSPSRTKMPSLDPGKDFGLLEGVRDPSVEMRLEATGLRARVSWRH
jgi:hypothetical protein